MWNQCVVRTRRQIAAPSANGLIVDIFLLSYIRDVEWEIEFTDEFERWWNGLSEDEQVSVDSAVRLLAMVGPTLRYPYSSGVNGSRHSRMRELRVQHEGRPYRVLYAFDSRRIALLLLAGDKTGNERWYEENVPLADRLYDEHLAVLEKEGLSHGEEVP